MRFDILTLFPDMIENYCSQSILKRAQERNIIEVNTVNPRDFSLDKHKKVDDTPYGGGAGMVLMPQPYVDAYESVERCENSLTVMLTPQGKPFDEKIQLEILDSLKPDYVQGITFLGGEPFEEENQRELRPFMKKVRELYPNKNVWCFTGYVYDRDLVPGGRKYTEDTDEMLDMIDVLVDGPYIQEERDLRIKFRGSRNQRLIDMKKTRECGTIVLMNL